MLLSFCPPGQVTRECQVGGDGLGKAARRGVLFELAVTQRGGHQQLLIPHAAVWDRHRGEDTQ